VSLSKTSSTASRTAMNPVRAYDDAMSSIRLLAVLTLLIAAAAAHAGSPAAAATRCDVSKDGRRLGTTYVTRLTATNVSCTKAKSVVKAFHRCRRANGGVKGRCTSRVQGFRCTERRESIPTQFDARATCRDGSRVIRFNYEQFT
jgi:hypothetical protein